MSEIMDGGMEAGLRILLQLALDEMLNVIEAIDHNHETKRSPQKYGTPYGAINGMTKLREDILAQAAIWGIQLSPRRAPSATCEGERCFCGAAAEYKVGEEIPFDDPIPNRHNLTAYVCGLHFREIMGPIAGSALTTAREWLETVAVEYYRLNCAMWGPSGTRPNEAYNASKSALLEAARAFAAARKGEGS